MNKADFDPGTLIYIIIAVIAAIAGAIKKSNKKSNENKSEPEKKPVKTLEEILSETLGLPVEEPKVPQTVKPAQPSFSPGQKITIPYEQVHHAKNESDQAFLHEGVPATFVEHEEDFIKSTEIKGINVSEKAAFVDFNLKKAIIYSEILNRKY
jgi:hypothetical protein